MERIGLFDQVVSRQLTRTLSHTTAMLAAVLIGATALAATAGQTRYVEGEVIVTFKQTATPEKAKTKLKQHGLEFSKHFKELSRNRKRETGLVRSKDRSTGQLIATLSADPDIELAEPNFLRWISLSRPNDTFFSQLWGLDNQGQRVSGVTGTASKDIKYLPAWSLSQTQPTPPVVAVIDTGVDLAHPDLLANVWINPSETAGNSIDDDKNGYVDDYSGYDFASDLGDVVDSGNHGTHVSGTIAAIGNNAMGVIGVNPQARIMALKASNDGENFTSAGIIEAIQYATSMKSRGVNIVAINASFGGGGYSSAERSAIQSAGNAGIIFCAAAGNASMNHDVTPDYPSSYRLPNMIVVAASTQTDTLASFSDYGATTVDLAAPGANIMSTIPAVITGSVTAGSSNYTASAFSFSPFTSGLTGNLVDCGLGFQPNFPAVVRGNIALISRGSLLFSEKVANAMAAGATAVIIYNNIAGELSGTLQKPANWVPTIAVSQATGQALKSASGSARVVITFDQAKSFGLMNGTSMATPHVAGAVAFAAGNFPTDTVAARVQRILSNVDVISGLQGKVRTSGRLNLLRIVDANNNSMPDWWEEKYSIVSLANADTDGDGASDQAEWVAGTDPTRPSSFLYTLAPYKTNNGLVIRWPSITGKTYRVERSTNLVAGFKYVVQSNILATPPMNVELDSTPTSGMGYYRIQVEQ